MSNDNWKQIEEALKAPFSLNEIHFRQGRGGTQLAYIDARNVMRRLDQVVGIENWQDEYTEVSGRLICKLSIRVGGEWVSKCDGAGDTKIEGDKGGISDAFKRAAVRFGVGRYLYYLPTNANINNMPSWALPKESS